MLVTQTGVMIITITTLITTVPAHLLTVPLLPEDRPEALVLITIQHPEAITGIIILTQIVIHAVLISTAPVGIAILVVPILLPVLLPEEVMVAAGRPVHPDKLAKK